jgi:hypothetical protein
MANEMPDPSGYTGLTRTVLEYGEGFRTILGKVKQPGFSEADWAPMSALVNTERFERHGVFVGAKAETFGWDTYKSYITQFGGYAEWEGTLRRVTEVPGLVILELEERNTVNGVMDVSNTVTIYEFDEDGKVVHLDVYVMPLP